MSLTPEYAVPWIVVTLAAGVALVGMLGMFLASRILAPRRPSREKAMPYECGIPPAPHSWSQLNIRYYIFGILFLIFDVEAVFLFPWSVVFLLPAVPAAVFYAMLIFLAVLFFGVVYAWKKGVLQWR